LFKVLASSLRLNAAFVGLAQPFLGSYTTKEQQQHQAEPLQPVKHLANAAHTFSGNQPLLSAPLP
jgi:hypothetical protein